MNFAKFLKTSILKDICDFFSELHWFKVEEIIEKAETFQRRLSEMYSETCETPKMKLFAKIVDFIPPVTIFAKHFIWLVLQGYEYTLIKLKKILVCCNLFHKKSGLQSLQNFILNSISSSHYYPAVRH